MSDQLSLLEHLDPEDSQLEFKACKNADLPQDIWKTICAFANTEGGRLVLGVNSNHKPINLSADEIDKLQQDILSLCTGTFNYPIVPEIRTTGTVTTVYIPPSPAAVRPIYSRKRGLPAGAWVRIGSSTVQMTDEMRNQFATAARGGAELIEFPGLSYLDCFDNKLVEQYVEAVNKSRNNIYAGIEKSEVLKKMRAVTINGEPTLFGLLAFSSGTHLQEVTATTTNVAITQYPSDNKSSPGHPEITYIDNHEFNGNIVVQFEQAFTFIRSILPMTGKVGGDGRRVDHLTIPEIAIREALANALTHRDYGTYSSRVQIDIFTDRIEIINPGQSLVPIEFIDTTPSVSRNPYLMGFLKDLHITEQRARGIRTIRDSLHVAGLPEPKLQNLATAFRITLFNSAFLSSEDRDWLQQFKHHKLNSRQLTALTWLRNNDSGLSNSSYREMNHMTSLGDDRRANYELNRLSKLGVIRHDGADRNRKYYLDV